MPWPAADRRAGFRSDGPAAARRRTGCPARRGGFSAWPRWPGPERHRMAPGSSRQVSRSRSVHCRPAPAPRPADPRGPRNRAADRGRHRLAFRRSNREAGTASSSRPGWSCRAGPHRTGCHRTGDCRKTAKQRTARRRTGDCRKTDRQRTGCHRTGDRPTVGSTATGRRRIRGRRSARRRSEHRSGRRPRTAGGPPTCPPPPHRTRSPAARADLPAPSRRSRPTADESPRCPSRSGAWSPDSSGAGRGPVARQQHRRHLLGLSPGVQSRAGHRPSPPHDGAALRSRVRG